MLPDTMLSRRPFAVLSLVLALSACAAAPGASPQRASSGVRQPTTSPYRPQIQNLPGLEGVIGATPAQLSRQFGHPRLDVWEGDARKLQFTGSPCILDVYLYPSAPGREPQATYVDARRSTDGQDVDRAACVSALRRR